MTLTKTSRIELRTDPDTDGLISEAAAKLHVSKSAFIAEAAAQAAAKVIARSDVTVMAPEVFDNLMASLGTPDESPQMAALAAMPRLIER